MEINKISIPEGWRKVSIGECVVEKKKSPIKVDDAANFGLYPFFTSGEAVLQHDCKLIDGENLYLATGGMANVKYFNGEAAYSTDTYVLGIKENICPKFMYYVLLFLKQYIDINYFQGSGLKHLQKKDFKHHEIIIPESKDEQQRIADTLSKLDDSLSKTQSLINKYELIKRGLMQDLLTFGIDSKGNKRSENTHKFKDSPLGRIPEEWEWVELGKIIEKGKGVIQTGPFGSSLHANEYVSAGCAVIMPQDIMTNSIDWENISHITEDKKQSLRKHIVRKKDLLFARRGDLSKCVVIEEGENAICGTGCLLLRPNSAKINPYWLKDIYQQLKTQSQLLSMAVGTTMQNINANILSNLSLAFPSLFEQNIISAVIREQNDVIRRLEYDKRKYQQIKQGLLSDLITGKVRI